MNFSESLKVCRWQLFTVFVLLVVLYAKIVPDMVLDWYKDENYSHGFIVPLISGYFLYTRWAELKVTPVAPRNAGLLVIIFGFLQLIFAWLGSEYFSMRSSLIVLLVGFILYFWGASVLRVIAFPVAYLFFMVPIPYIIYDAVAFPLKLFVTKVSVAFLKLVGVVVLREGNIIMFPTTTLEVADACSGIRSLISLLALAVAYAFFLRIKPWKRVILICAAVPIAVATNAMRVIVTGILAQHWGEKAAQGFFHEFAGLAVFGVAMVLLVSLGVFLSRGQKTEDREQKTEDREQKTEDREQKTEDRGRFVIVYMLLIAAGLYLYLHSDVTVPINKPLAQFPATVSKWHMTGESFLSDDVQQVLKATDVLYRQYTGPSGKRVSLYIGYHGGGKGTGEIHSPKHCLPGSGWYELSSQRSMLVMEGEKLNLVRAVYQKGESKELFLYWFVAKGRTVNDEYSLKMSEITNSLLYRRRDTAFVRISIPFDTDERGSLETGERFIKDFYPIIKMYLPK
ncbi:MAG: EpsI family protein [Geobacter sp.]|nr:MAG: EpsI family protein [Geobacter sp.]